MLSKIKKYAFVFFYALLTTFFIWGAYQFYYNPDGILTKPDVERGFFSCLALVAACLAFSRLIINLMTILTWKSNLYDRLADKEDSDDE